MVSCNLRPENLKTADISRGYYWFPPQNSEFMPKDGSKKGMAKRLCDKRDSPISYVFGGDLHLIYCFLD